MRRIGISLAILSTLSASGMLQHAAHAQGGAVVPAIETAPVGKVKSYGPTPAAGSPVFLMGGFRGPIGRLDDDASVIMLKSPRAATPKVVNPNQ